VWLKLLVILIGWFGRRACDGECANERNDTSNVGTESCVGVGVKDSEWAIKMTILRRKIYEGV
jgi:hypothetical protein